MSKNCGFVAISLCVALALLFIAMQAAAVSQAGSPGSANASGSCGSHRFVSVAVGDCSLLALRDDGTVWTWGKMYCGEPALLPGHTVEEYYWIEPVPVQVPISDVTAIAAGGDFGLALKNDGTVWTWGYGPGTRRGNISIVQVEGLQNVTAISAGLNGLALKSDGTVWAWGCNWGGQLGDGTRVDRSLPVQVKGLSNIASIWGGSFAIGEDGTVWTWGTTFSGAAAEPGCMDIGSPTPFQIHGLKGVIAIDMDEASSHVLFLRDDGSVWGWDTPVSTGQFNPYRVEAKGFSNITAVQACGGGGSMALKDDGTVWIWGNDASGQLASDLISNGPYYYGASTPMELPGFNGVVAISSHYSNSLFLKDDGSVWVCGDGSYGEAGNGTFVSQIHVPIKVLGPGGVPSPSPSWVIAPNDSPSPAIPSASNGEGIRNSCLSILVAFSLLSVITVAGAIYFLFIKR
ncbi:RCC1 domain-containing protein [Methanocella conradii]|uniref:RCC1 domain-containing protein n=1 Tax=Methanocella conradii TaxID=1175444 RepID=UPI0024B329A1|nr:hypothetical protein [Methanocella conradii]MDI6897246.1 hypothetical protein [Methanocella conradii]